MKVEVENITERKWRERKVVRVWGEVPDVARRRKRSERQVRDCSRGIMSVRPLTHSLIAPGSGKETVKHLHIILYLEFYIHFNLFQDGTQLRDTPPCWLLAFQNFESRIWDAETSVEGGTLHLKSDIFEWFPSWFCKFSVLKYYQL